MRYSEEFLPFYEPADLKSGDLVSFDLGEGSVGTGIIRGLAANFPVIWILEIVDRPTTTYFQDYPYPCFNCPQARIRVPAKKSLQVPLPQIKKLGVKPRMDFSVTTDTEKTALFKLCDHVDRPRNPLR